MLTKQFQIFKADPGSQPLRVRLLPCVTVNAQTCHIHPTPPVPSWALRLSRCHDDGLISIQLWLLDGQGPSRGTYC